LSDRDAIPSADEQALHKTDRIIQGFARTLALGGSVALCAQTYSLLHSEAAMRGGQAYMLAAQAEGAQKREPIKWSFAGSQRGRATPCAVGWH
jgi:hypothetical protein